MKETGRVDLQEYYLPTHDCFTNQAFLAASEFIFIPYLLHVHARMAKGYLREAIELFRTRVRAQWPSSVPDSSEAWSQLRDMVQSVTVIF